MTIKNYLIAGIGVCWPAEPITILEIADKIVRFVDALANVDPIFHSFTYTPRKKNKTDFNVKANNKKELIAALANCILEDFRGDINHHEKVGRPTLDYRRDFGFRPLLNFKVNGKIAFSIIPSLGNKGYDGFNIEYFKSGFAFPYEWFIDIFEAMVVYTKPLYGCIRLNSPRLNTSIHAKWQLGIGAYFSADLQWVIEDLNIEKREHEKIDGVFVYPVNPGFSKDKENYDAAIGKLIELNQSIAKGENIHS